MIVELNGSQRGGWLYADGTPYAQRSLPPNLVIREFSRFELASGGGLPRGWQIESFVVAPWFGQPGGGTAYRLLDQNNHTGPLLRLIDAGLARSTHAEITPLPVPPDHIAAPMVDLRAYPEPYRPVARAWFQWRIIAIEGRQPFFDAKRFPWLPADFGPLLTASERLWGEEQPLVTDGMLTFSLGGIEFGFFLNTDDKWVVQQRDRNIWHQNWGFLLLDDAQKFLLFLIAEEARALRGLPNIGTSWYRDKPACGIESVRYQQDSRAGAVYIRAAGSKSEYLAWMDEWDATRFAPAFGYSYNELHTVLSQDIPPAWFVELG
ncbi:TNT domain-containing protein [Mycolicibacter sinensis]|uniref:TNT domain-containing protein n=1 Tax=Mycolicibacter sinensis (strain JDM601) TaxID=875328 RepID=UPI0009ED7340|nr:glycohydrolase toxin TNT-related protein [Mycolicibacter sinensis]